MSSSPRAGHVRVYRSIVTKNIVLFLLILLVAVVPLALRYDLDSRDYEIRNLASKLEFFAERGATWLDPQAIATLTEPSHKTTPAYQNLLQHLQRITQEFGVDNAIVMRREADKKFTFIAADHDGFEIRQPVFIHDAGWFPETYAATNETWESGEMAHSRLFGGVVIADGLSGWLAYSCRLLADLHEQPLWKRLCNKNTEQQNFGQFLQINTPLKVNNNVVAILMLNKNAESVAAAVHAKTVSVLGLSSVIVIVGLCLFGLISNNMLRPLRHLTFAAGEVAHGNLDIIVPAPRRRDEIGRLSVAFDSMIEGLRQRDFIRDTFGRYISKEVVEQVLGSPDGLKLGGELREVTFLVSDLRGFSSMASRLDPHTVITIINRYLEGMIEIIMRYRGTVDEFQGDGILAFFGAPISARDDAERAVACAIEMQRALVDINTDLKRQGFPELAMGIGLNVGQVIVGNIGSEKRTKYGAMGSPINTAYRIESYTIGGQILSSPNFYERVSRLVEVRSTMDVQFKGVEQPVTLYDIVGIGAPYRLRLPEKTPDIFTPLEPPLPIHCYPLDGKTVSAHALAGYITELAASGAKMAVAGQLAVRDNVKLVFTPEAAATFEGYAKVLQLEPARTRDTDVVVSLEFTSLADDSRQFLEQQRTMVMQAGQKRGL